MKRHYGCGTTDERKRNISSNSFMCIINEHKCTRISKITLEQIGQAFSIEKMGKRIWCSNSPKIHSSMETRTKKNLEQIERSPISTFSHRSPPPSVFDPVTKNEIRYKRKYRILR